MEPERLPGRRPIGEIFVERGYVSEIDLEHALAEQRETGGKLGEILVERGLISRLALASVLGEQWDSRGPHVVQGGVAGPDAPVAAIGPLAELRELVDDLRAVVVALQGAAESLGGGAPAPSRPGWESVPAAADPAALAERDAAIAELRATVAQLEARLGPGGPEPAPWEATTASRHVALLPASDGYALVELDGPAPEPGATVELPGRYGRFAVTRVVSSPLPGDARPCVHLARLTDDDWA